LSGCSAFEERNFVVGSYSCPYESGNRLHRFMNSMIWALLTNRTFLARYHTAEVCTEYGEGFCVKYSDSSAEDCHEVLHLSSWVPLYDEWKYKIKATTINNTIITTNDNTTLAENNMTRKRTNAPNVDPIVRAEPQHSMRKSDWIPDKEALPYDGELNKNNRIIRTGPQYKIDPVLILQKDVQEIRYLSLPSNLERLHLLRDLGPYFIYGMIFESLFTLDPSLFTSDNDDEYSHLETYFLHSRHPAAMALGYTYPEELCLSQILDEAARRKRDNSITDKNISSATTNSSSSFNTTIISHNATISTSINATISNNATDSTSFNTTNDNNVTCLVYLMSDRSKTLQLLSKAIQKGFLNAETLSPCMVRSVGANQSKAASFSKEHGPFAGRGYWEDVALTTRARNGMVAYHVHPRNYPRTSTSLVREIVEFRRLLEFYGSHNTAGERLPPPFLECTNPRKKQK